MNRHTKRILHRTVPIAGLLIVGSLLLAVTWQALPFLGASTFGVAVGPGFGPSFPEPPSPIPADPGSGDAPLPGDPEPAVAPKPICQCPAKDAREPLTICAVIHDNYCPPTKDKASCIAQQPRPVLMPCDNPTTTGADCTSQTFEGSGNGEACIWVDAEGYVNGGWCQAEYVDYKKSCQEYVIGERVSKIVSNECGQVMAIEPPSNPSIHAQVCSEYGCVESVTYNFGTESGQWPLTEGEKGLFKPELNHYSCEPIMSTVQ